MTKYKDRYRIESARLPNWDYRIAGYYFVTICTRGKSPFFGSIVDGKTCLSPIGIIVSHEWREIPAHHRGIELDQWIIMPNHLHGIIVINGSDQPKNARQIQPVSLGVIVNQFKGRCTRHIHASGAHNFSWQSGYYDRILRDEKTLARVRAYIQSNPEKWQLDKEIVENIDDDFQ